MKIHSANRHLRTSGRFFTVLTVLLLASLLRPQTLRAQSPQRFKAGLIAGLTASQIDGDESAGYHKVGLQGGLRGVVALKPKQEASVEILYSQRGCRNQPKTFPIYSTTLDYIEVPVQWHYKDWFIEDGAGDESQDFYRVQFNIGASYGRLLGFRDDSEGGGITEALPDLNRNSFCFVVGGSFFASRHLGFTFRYHRALNRLYNPRDSGGYFQSLHEHYLAFQAVYMF